MTNELTAFDEERELTRRQRDDVAIVAPQVGEALAFESFLEDAKASAVPHQDLASLSARVHEEKQVA